MIIYSFCGGLPKFNIVFTIVRPRLLMLGLCRNPQPSLHFSWQTIDLRHFQKLNERILVNVLSLRKCLRMKLMCAIPCSNAIIYIVTPSKYGVEYASNIRNKCLFKLNLGRMIWLNLAYYASFKTVPIGYSCWVQMSEGKVNNTFVSG